MPVYDDFDEMLREVKPDTVIVTTKDSMHDFYVIKALEAGCDVIVEKPMTTTFDKANAIKEAEEKSGKKVTVVFNLRYLPFFVTVKPCGLVILPISGVISSAPRNALTVVIVDCCSNILPLLSQ